MGSKNAERGGPGLKAATEPRAPLTEFVDEQQYRVIRSHPWNSDRAYQDDYYGFWAYRNGQFSRLGGVCRRSRTCLGFNRHAVLIWNVQSGAPEPPREQIGPQ
jgi:hypothetical protein